MMMTWNMLSLRTVNLFKFTVSIGRVKRPFKVPAVPPAPKMLRCGDFVMKLHFIDKKSNRKEFR